MSLETLIAFNLTLFAALVSPGPALLVSIRTGLVHGRMAGIKVGLGLGFMAAFWTMLALLGLKGAFDIFPWAYTTMKIAGAIYLLYLGWKTWLGAKKPLDGELKPGRHHFRDGILLNLANPKSVLFAAAVIIVIFPPDLSLVEKSIIIFNQCAIEMIFYSLMALTISTEVVSKQYQHAKPWADRFSAIILGGLGLKLLVHK